jgi:hypothetical protein
MTSSFSSTPVVAVSGKQWLRRLTTSRADLLYANRRDIQSRTHRNVNRRRPAPVSINAFPTTGAGVATPSFSSFAANAGCTEISALRTAPVPRKEAALGCRLSSRTKWL